MRPLARWTVGPVSKLGIEVLKHSVNSFKGVYPEFDTIVCYNNISREDVMALNLGVELYEQKQSDIDYPLQPPDESPTGPGMAGSGWKLCPPRLRIDGHEIWIDNDIVIRDRIKEVDRWLSQGASGFISEGLNRLFGIYEDLVPAHIKACAGFFGLPPNFDFNLMIQELCRMLDGTPLGHYNEQGLVAAIITNTANYSLIPMSSVTICEDTFNVPIPLPSAIHFVGVNRVEHHGAWYQFLNTSIKAL